MQKMLINAVIMDMAKLFHAAQGYDSVGDNLNAAEMLSNCVLLIAFRRWKSRLASR
jgi:hypothetical protein